MFFKCSVLFIVNSISPLCLLCLLLILYTSVMYQLSCSVLVMLILTLAMTLDATVNWIWYLIDWLGLVSLAILWLHDRCDKNLPICWQACKWLQTLFYNIGSISANFSCQFTNWPVNGNPLLVITDYNLQPVLCLEKWASCTLCDKIAKSQPNRMQLWSDSFKCSCDHIWKFSRKIFEIYTIINRNLSDRTPQFLTCVYHFSACCFKWLLNLKHHTIK